MTDGHSESTDEMLMVRYKRGDQYAFAELVRRYQRPLFNFSVRFIGSRDVAQEITQDAFLKLVKCSAAFKHESRFSTWLFAITRNLCIDELRRSSHRNHPSLNDPEQSEDKLTSAISENQRALDGENGTATSELRSGIVRAIDTLPLEQKEVFLLRQLGCVPFAEIARITETPENTVKSRMRYALSRLQKQLNAYKEFANN